MGPPGLEPGTSGSAGQRHIHARPRALPVIYPGAGFNLYFFQFGLYDVNVFPVLEIVKRSDSVENMRP